MYLDYKDYKYKHIEFRKLANMNNFLIIFYIFIKKKYLYILYNGFT